MRVGKDLFKGDIIRVYGSCRLKKFHVFLYLDSLVLYSRFMILCTCRSWKTSQSGVHGV
jgi:hypothetical protein